MFNNITQNTQQNKSINTTQTEQKIDTKTKIADTRKKVSILKQIDKLEKEVNKLKKQIATKEKKISELASTL